MPNHNRIASLRDLTNSVALKLFGEIRFAHDALPASKLGKKASTDLGAIQNQPYIMATALSKAAPKMAGGTSLPLPLAYSRPVLLSCFLRLPVLPAGLALNRRVFPTGSGIDARRLRGASGLILFEDYKLQLKRKLRATYLRYLLFQRHECQEQAS